MVVVKGIFNKNNEHQWRECEKVFLEVSNEDQIKGDISIITSKGYDQLKHDENKGFCHHRFKANLIIEGLDADKITHGDLVTIGEVLLEITKVGKRCHGECPVLLNNKTCTLKQHIFFARTIRPGKIQVQR